MRTSKTIAALIGPTLMASAISIFVNLDVWPAMVDQVFQNAGIVFLSGYPLFVAGLAIVYFHNHWLGGWPVLVTALGWLAFLGGLSRILFPTHLAGIAARAVHTASVMPAVAVVVLLLGALLSFQAYRRGWAVGGCAVRRSLRQPDR